MFSPRRWMLLGLKTESHGGTGYGLGASVDEPGELRAEGEAGHRDLLVGPRPHHMCRASGSRDRQQARGCPGGTYGMRGFFPGETHVLKLRGGDILKTAGSYTSKGKLYDVTYSCAKMARKPRHSATSVRDGCRRGCSRGAGSTGGEPGAVQSSGPHPPPLSLTGYSNSTTS